VVVYQLSSSALIPLQKALRGEKFEVVDESTSTNISELVRILSSADKGSVAFNFECCSQWDCSGQGGGFHFPHKNATMQAIKLMLDRGYMIMFSDFALKALISDWSESHLGPNPFKNVGEFSGNFTLKFLPEELKACPSAQLQKVGELCEVGEAKVHAMGGTILYTVIKSKADNSQYKLKVLTVATQCGETNIDVAGSNLCTVGQHTGVAGHVLLTYPTGGQLLVSCGHWIELARLDVSMENLLKVAQTTYGAAYSEQIQQEWTSASSDSARGEVVQRYAKQWVQESVPAMYSSNM